jgi:hypothetical protein
MLGALFGLIMLGVGWLVIWSCVDHSKPSETWWPFAMRTTTGPVTIRADEPPQQIAPWRASENPSRPWRRSDLR